MQGHCNCTKILADELIRIFERLDMDVPNFNCDLEQASEDMFSVVEEDLMAPEQGEGGSEVSNESAEQSQDQNEDDEDLRQCSRWVVDSKRE